MTVATIDADGSPDARMLLLKSVDDRGFVFFTNMESPKAKSLQRDPRVALCFYWMPLDRQVRIRGRAETVSEEEADAYFATRPRLSQISAWASKQSRPMQGYFELETEVAKATLRFGIGKIPRPPFWSGFQVVPDEIEFWTGKLFRRHHRILYTRTQTAGKSNICIRDCRAADFSRGTPAMAGGQRIKRKGQSDKPRLVPSVAFISFRVFPACFVGSPSIAMLHSMRSAGAPNTARETRALPDPRFSFAPAAP